MQQRKWEQYFFLQRPSVVIGMLHVYIVNISTLLWFALLMPRIAQNVLLDAFKELILFICVCDWSQITAVVDTISR